MKRLVLFEALLAVISLFAIPPSNTAKPQNGPQDPSTAIDFLSFSGDWAEGTPDRMTRNELAALDSYRTIRSEIVPRAGAADLGVVPLTALIDILGMRSNADGVVLECTDGWESFMEIAYIRENEPLLLLYYNGEAPESGEWPWFGGDIEPLEPFYVFIEGRLDSYQASPPFGMISATQMSGLRAVNTSKRYAPFFEPPMDELSDQGQTGRSLFLQRCNNCHQGPGMVGGNVSLRPFSILQTHARYNVSFFRSMVKNPKAVYPDTIMPNHDDFTEGDLDALIAFLSESASLGEKFK